MTTRTTYVFTGQPVEFVVPPGVTRLDVDGTGGAGYSFGIGNDGGLGGRVRCTLTVTPGERLWLRVAGRGDQGGWNGGGLGAGGRHGGGATDIRRGGDTLAHRILVAPGGGAASGAGANGGAGGLNGAAGAAGSFGSRLGGTGGTQSAGGSIGGALGVGGGSTSAISPGGGGGGGRYGGGAGQDATSIGGSTLTAGGGGGGSALVPAGGTASAGLGADGTLTLTYDRPPEPPDRLTPPAGSAFARPDRNRLSWRHNDPDGDGQDAYLLSLLTPGTNSWGAPVLVQTPNTFHDLAANMPLGAYQWRVATRNAGGTSAYSQAGTFTIGDRAPGPTWLDPINGQAIPTRQYALRWSGTGVQYRIRSVRDNNGMRDESVVHAQVGPLPVGNRTVEWTFPVNGRAEWLLLEEADANGLWSVVSAARVAAQYTLPARALVALGADVERLAIVVQITSPTESGRPVAARHGVRVRPVGDTSDGMLVTDNAGRNGRVLYRFPALGVQHEVLVSTVGENGAVEDGAWTAVSTTGTTPTDPTVGSGRYGTARYGTSTYG